VVASGEGPALGTAKAAAHRVRPNAGGKAGSLPIPMLVFVRFGSAATRGASQSGREGMITEVASSRRLKSARADSRIVRPVTFVKSARPYGIG